jgi:hypothetical protein
VSAEALQQVRTAAAWVGTLRPGQPFVVWVDPFGSAGALSPALKERTIRAALPADLQARFHMVAGTLLDDLVSAPLGGPFGSGLSPAMRTAVLPYWRDARPFLVGGAPVVVLRALDPPDFEAARRADIAFPIGSGTIAIRNDRGRGPARSFVGAPQPDAFPGAIRAALWSIGLLALLMAAGLGWTRALLGRGPDPRVVFGLAPALGAAALVIVGTASSRLGMSLGGQTAWIVWALTTVGGFAAAALAGRDGKEDLPTPPDVGSNDG